MGAEEITGSPAFKELHTHTHVFFNKLAAKIFNYTNSVDVPPTVSLIQNLSH